MTGNPAASASGAPLSVPILAFAELTAQAILLVDPIAKTAIFASSRACNLLCRGGCEKGFPASLSEIFAVDEQLNDQFRLALMSNAALTLGLVSRDGSERIAAKVQRLDFQNAPPLLLISLQDEPELSRRFKSLSEEILSLNQQIALRREAERSLSLTTSALRRSLAIVKELAGIAAQSGKHLGLATKTILNALCGHSAATFVISGAHLTCVAAVGSGLSGLKINTQLKTFPVKLLSASDNDLLPGDVELIAALGEAAGLTFDPARTCVIPFATSDKPKGAMIVVANDPSTFADLTGFEIGIIREALGSLVSRAEMEAQLSQSSKMEAIGRLTGGIAHDFNNLLTVVLGNAEALTERLAEQPDMREMAEITVNAATRGSELTSRLLAFARKQTLEPRVMDVSHLIQGMDSLLRRTLPENIAIEVVRAGGLWKTEVDPGQLESALLNLALNARDAMPYGGSLTIEIANAALDDDYVIAEPGLEAGQYVLIAVTDTGGGIPPENLQQIFQPFFTTKEVGKGTGLGLSMVYGFVKQSGGHIRVYSEIGEGTSIKLYFPRSFAHNAEIALKRSNHIALGGTEAVLVVEDDKLVRSYVVSQLKALGYSVFEAADAKGALEILNQSPDIDLLFTDVVMPGGMGGRELSEHARALRPALKVLFTSGYTENSIVHNGRLDAGVELLSKPYRREQLALKLRKVLEGK
ncbi:ATP-binding protein [Microcoleus sp. Pol14D5]